MWHIFNCSPIYHHVVYSLNNVFVCGTGKAHDRHRHANCHRDTLFLWTHMQQDLLLSMRIEQFTRYFSLKNYSFVFFHSNRAHIWKLPCRAATKNDYDVKINNCRRLRLRHPHHYPTVKHTALIHEVKRSLLSVARWNRLIKSLKILKQSRKEYFLRMLFVVCVLWLMYYMQQSQNVLTHSHLQHNEFNLVLFVRCHLLLLWKGVSLWDFSLL